jgi:hypothetical protein
MATWVTDQDDRNLYAKAKADGADDIILATEESTQVYFGYLTSKVNMCDRIVLCDVV